MPDPNPNPAPPADPNPPAPPAPPPGPIITMTEDEKKAYDARLIARARYDLEKKLGVTEKDVEELATLRQERQARELKEKAERGQFESALEQQRTILTKEKDDAVKGTQGERDRFRDRLEDVTIKATLVGEAARLNAYDPDETFSLLRHRVRLNPETLEAEVLMEDGKTPAIGAGGKAMTPAELVKSFLDKKPHLVKSQQPGGGGGMKGGAAQVTGDTSPIAELEGKIAAASKRYQETQDTRYLTEKQNLSNELARLKAKGAAA